jgi:hypothetical protein
MLQEAKRDFERSFSSELTLSHEAMVPVGTIPRCIDDREIYIDPVLYTLHSITPPEDFNGPQWLGGSLAPLALALETTPGEARVNFGETLDMVKSAHDSLGLELGIHMDDHHGEMTAQEIVDVVQNGADLHGCGFAGLLVSDENPLKLKDRTREALSSASLTRTLVAKGSKISVLRGDHSPIGQVTAIENYSPNLTLNQSRAHSLGSPSYNHDTAKLNEMLGALAWQASRISPQWAENLQAQGAQINETWLKTTTMILAGKNPVPIKGLDFRIF